MNLKVKEMEQLFLTLKSKDKNINGVGLSRKITNNKITGDKSITVYVNKKLPLSAMKPDKVVDNSYYFSGELYSTDVIEGSSHFLNNQITPCHIHAADLFLPPENSILYPNRARVNYLSGGCNFTKWSPGDYFTFCTLGGIFKDKSDNTYVGLTNRHCVDRLKSINLIWVDPLTYSIDFSGSMYFNIPFLNYHSISKYNREIQFYDNTLPNYEVYTTNMVDTVSNYNMYNANFYQPSRFSDPGGVPNMDVLSGENCIGFLKRAAPVIIFDSTLPQTFNYTDAAIIALTDNGRVNSTSRGQIGFDEFNFNDAIRIATDEEIDEVFVNQYPMFYSGSRTGPNGNSYGCHLSAFSNYRVAEIPVLINDEIYGSDINYTFSDIVEFYGLEFDTTILPGEISPTTFENFKVVLSGGDSGSIIWGKLPDGWKILGLNFAGFVNEGYTFSTGFFCRITNVFKELNIDVWNGEQLNFSKPMHTVTIKNIVDFSKPMEDTDLGEEVINKIKIDNKDYYYSGVQYTNNFNNISYKL